MASRPMQVILGLNPNTFPNGNDFLTTSTPSQSAETYSAFLHVFPFLGKFCWRALPRALYVHIVSQPRHTRVGYKSQKHRFGPSHASASANVHHHLPDSAQRQHLLPPLRSPPGKLQVVFVPRVLRTLSASRLNPEIGTLSLRCRCGRLIKSATRTNGGR
jgi:hypothetical protein